LFSLRATWGRCGQERAESIAGLGRVGVVSEVARDERIVLFATAAHRASDRRGWLVPVHGRVFRPPEGRAAKAALALALKTGFGVSPDASSRPVFDERCALMLADNRAGRRIVVTVAGADHQLAPTDRYGQFRGSVFLPDAAAAAFAAGGRIEVAARLASRDHRRFTGHALLLEAEGLSIISDIDDTVKVTHVASRRRMMALTFLEAFQAVAGMADRYRSWVAQGASLHFVSSSPWPLYEPIEAFLAAAGFPHATTTLKTVALKDRSIRNLLAKATKTKPPAIDAILRDFPHRRFVLIGDSAENDAEIYADAARRHGVRVRKILIRDCGGRRTCIERARQALSGLDPATWQIFERADELPATLG
jgi:phosphatidate phosphatase APP1